MIFIYRTIGKGEKICYLNYLVKTKTNPDEDEFLEIVKIPISELKHKIETFEICDAKTVIAILMSEKYMYRED